MEMSCQQQHDMVRTEYTPGRDLSVGSIYLVKKEKYNNQNVIIYHNVP